MNEKAPVFSLNMRKRKNIEALPKILIVEDTPVLQVIYERYLKYLNYNVILCKSGKEALDYLTRQSFKAIILDLGLPDISGEEVLMRIRSQETQTNAHIPIIVVTAYNDPIRLKRCCQQGADKAFLKPITFQGLRQALYDVFSETSVTPSGQEMTV